MPKHLKKRILKKPSLPLLKSRPVRLSCKPIQVYSIKRQPWLDMANVPIIVALDLPTLEGALELVDRLPQVEWWKVGPHLFCATGPAVIHALKDRGKRLFLDLKLHDIPSVVAHACGTVAGYGVDMLTLHAAGGSQMLAQSAQAVAATDCRLLAVTLLTSLDPQQVRQELRIEDPVLEQVTHWARMAQDCGIHGAVSAGLEVKTLRQACGDDFVLVTPGIRDVQVDEVGDQSRVLGPAEAVQMGSNYLVVGRPITRSQDPAAAFARFQANSVI